MEKQQSTTLGRDDGPAGATRAEAIAWVDQKAATLRTLQRVDNPERPAAPTQLLVEDYLTLENHRGHWVERTREKQAELAARFLPEPFLARPCRLQRLNHFQSVLDDAASSGIGDARLDDVRRMLTNLASWGYAGEWFLPGQKTVEGLVTPRDLGDWDEEEDGESRITRDDIPTNADLVRIEGELVDDEVCLGLFRLAKSSGARWGELIGLVPDKFDFEGGTVAIDYTITETTSGRMYKSPTKNRRRRKVPLDPADAALLVRLCAAARARMEADPDDRGLVFPAPKGGWWRRSNFVRRRWKPVRERAGWRDDWTFHSVRHWVAIHLIEDLELPLTRVAKILGHRDSTVTERIYCEGRGDAAESVAGMYGWGSQHDADVIALHG